MSLPSQFLRQRFRLLLFNMSQRPDNCRMVPIDEPPNRWIAPPLISQCPIQLDTRSTQVRMSTFPYHVFHTDSVFAGDPFRMLLWRARRTLYAAVKLFLAELPGTHGLHSGRLVVTSPKGI